MPKKLLTVFGITTIIIISIYYFQFHSQNKKIDPTNNPFVLPEETLFINDLNNALKDEKLGFLASKFKENCSTDNIGSATFGNAKTFRELLPPINEVDTTTLMSDAIFIIPCSEGSYQSSYMIVLYDGKTYTPIQIPNIDQEGKINYYYSGVEIDYNSTTNTVSTMASLNGMHTCWESSESKLIERKLVLQKIIADRECDDEIGEGEVIYDIKKGINKF